ncbi:MAG: cytochrome c oxidase subunit II [Gemmatimonadota bacterium]
MNEKRITLEVLALALLFLGIMLFTVIGFATKNWLPPVASLHGVGVDGVITYLLITTGAILVIGHLVLIAFLWRYSRGKPTQSPRTSPQLERRWSVIPVLGMALIAEVGVLAKGLPVWEQVYGEVPDDALVIEVTAKQFEWIVRYPGVDGTFGRIALDLIDGRTNPAGLDADDPAALDDLIFRNALHVPVDRAIDVRLRSRDVLHSFSVNAFRVKQDVVPGIIGSTHFVPTLPGEYELGCAELCGMGHYQMSGRVVVHTAEEFEQWLSNQAGWFE